ncbi:MAG: rhodanese-like domain-containing protein, partial [Lachnospiraceae bacterium]
MLRKVTALFLCILTTVFLCSSCAGEGSSAYKAISVKEAKDMMDKGGVIVVDVRRADEYAESHIPGALNIANEDISTTPPAALPDKDASILVYCRTGVRSKEAAQKLAQMGYRNIYEFGGIADWQYATVSGSDAGSWTKDGEEESEDGQGTQNGAASSTGIMGSFSAYDLQKNAVNQDILK